jgi:DNA-binding HxlR family transcriptional regulator
MSVNPHMVREILRGIPGRWGPAILVSLEDGPKRSAELRRSTSPTLDWRGFIDTIDRLMARGIIVRREHRNLPTGADGPERGEDLALHVPADAARPDEVWYELTGTGRSVLELLADVETWARDHPTDAARLRLTPENRDCPGGEWIE